MDNTTLLRATRRIALEAMHKNTEALASIEQALALLEAAVKGCCEFEACQAGVGLASIQQTIDLLEKQAAVLQPVYE